MSGWRPVIRPAIGKTGPPTRSLDHRIRTEEVGPVVSTIEESIEVEVPVSTAYNQWTQFESFPEFIESRGSESGAWRGDVDRPGA
jgi:hypothetical protein